MLLLLLEFIQISQSQIWSLPLTLKSFDGKALLKFLVARGGNLTTAKNKQKHEYDANNIILLYFYIP